MDAIRLRFPNRELDDLTLTQGVHAIGRDENTRLVVVRDPASMLLQFCVDRRGIWLQSHEGVRGLHVNGRPVRHMALLRAGDAVYFEGIEMLLVGAMPPSAPAARRGEVDGSRNAVLRGVGGTHHGRCFTLDRVRTIGRSAECDVVINDAAIAERHATLEPHPDGIVLRCLAPESGNCAVNGQTVQHALLGSGDQLVVGAQHRFVIETPMRSKATSMPSIGHLTSDEPTELSAAGPQGQVRSSARRLPWLLLAALLLAGGLSLLLLYGAR